MGKESKVAERQREIECVCVWVLIETDDSVDQHPQTLLRFLTVGLLFGSDIWIDDNSRKVTL